MGMLEFKCKISDCHYLKNRQAQNVCERCDKFHSAWNKICPYLHKYNRFCDEILVIDYVMGDLSRRVSGKYDVAIRGGTNESYRKKER